MNTPEDILATRIVDRTASSDDWIAFEELAQRDGGVWERLHLAMQDDLLLRSVVEHELAAADAIELVGPEAEFPIARFLAPAGWLAALVMTLLWLGQSPLLQRQSAGQDALEPLPLRGSTISTDSKEREKEFGDVLEHLPSDVLELNPHGDGRVEVVYLRQTIERAIVNGAYGLVEDDLGNRRPLLISPAKLGKPRDF